MLDFTKPMRHKGDKTEVKLAAFFMDDATAEGYRKFMRQGAAYMGTRLGGQTLLIEDGENEFGWYFPDGRLIEADSVIDLENFEPPVVVKVQRQVRYLPHRNDNPISTQPVASYDRHGVIGIVEFTLTDGKLTNVEIVR